MIGGQDAEPFLDGKLVLAPVFLIEFTPVTSHVAADEFQRSVAGLLQRSQSARRGHDLTKREFGLHGFLRQISPSANSNDGAPCGQWPSGSTWQSSVHMAG